MKLECWGCSEKPNSSPKKHVAQEWQNFKKGKEAPHQDYSTSTASSVKGNGRPGSHYGRGFLDSPLAWVPSRNRRGEWFQVDVGKITKICGVEVAGMKNNPHKSVTKFRVLHGRDGKHFHRVDHGHHFGVFKAKPGQRPASVFAKPIFARYVRLIVEAWKGSIALRAYVDVCGNYDTDGLKCFGNSLPVTEKSVELSNNAIGVNIRKENRREIKQFVRYTINVGSYDPAISKTTKIDGYPQKLKSLQHLIKDLSPGKWFKVDIIPHDNQQKTRLLTPLTAELLLRTACGCDRNTFDKRQEFTGKPVKFKVTQNEGFMRFSWVDKSLCEEGFSFYREADTKKVAFTDDYMYASTDKCGRLHEPEFVKEELAVSHLPVNSLQK
jgi:hypothetical protein